MAETLYDLWGKKNPDFETRFEPLLRQYCDYGFFHYANTSPGDQCRYCVFCSYQALRPLFTLFYHEITGKHQ